jgi:hypothetical protein
MNTLEQQKCQLEQMTSRTTLQEQVRHGSLLPKLYWPSVRKKCSSDQEKHL